MVRKYHDDLKLMVVRKYQIFRPVGKGGPVRLEVRKGILNRREITYY